jgi:hypothetical protein
VAVRSASTGALSMDAAISTAANVFNIVFILLERSARSRFGADAVDYADRQ